MRALALSVLSVLALAGPGTPARAEELPPSSVKYAMEVKLEPSTRALTGREVLSWVNHGEQPIAAVPIHLYLNAFAHEKTSWMREELSPDDLDSLLERDPDPFGQLTLTRVAQRSSKGPLPASWRAIQPDDGNPLDRSLAEVSLPEPVAPGATLLLELDFSAHLPLPIARTGGFEDFFLVAQWYPKIAVLETEGIRHAAHPRWAARQFHAATEFYADFADYDVEITVPHGWTVAATGHAEPAERPSNDKHSTVRYRQNAVIDFAFAAGSSLFDKSSQVRLGSEGPQVSLRILGPLGSESLLPRLERAAAASLNTLSRRVGRYPYANLTVVCPPWRATETGGMEYPTLVTAMPADPLFEHFPFDQLRLPEMVLMHEIGHQWFYGLLASNEVDEAFLDEGFNTYWEAEQLEELFGDDLGSVLGLRVRTGDGRSGAAGPAAELIDEPLRKRPSYLFRDKTGGSQIYHRAAFALRTAARTIGVKQVDQSFAAYFEAFAFHHPDALDFLGVVRSSSGNRMSDLLQEAFDTTRVPDFRVDRVESTPHLAPRGHVFGDDIPIRITDANQSTHPEVGLDPLALEADRRVLIEITDPGWVRGYETQTGTISRRLLDPDRASRTRPEHPPFTARTPLFDSLAEISGPAWEHLPVEVELRFSDGVILRDHWDGRGAWRRYRFTRPAELTDVRVDPDGLIALDVRPENNARSRVARSSFALEWAGWLAQVAELLAAGVSAWL